MVSCCNSSCTRDIQEIDKMGFQTGRMEDIATIMAKKAPNQQQWSFAVPKHPILTGMQGLQPHLGPTDWGPSKTSLSCRKCPYRALPCHGATAFSALSWNVPKDGPTAAEAAASWEMPVHPQYPSPFQSHPWHWVWHCWSLHVGGTNEGRTEGVWVPPCCSSRDWQAHGSLWCKVTQPGYTRQKHKSSCTCIF